MTRSAQKGPPIGRRTLLAAAGLAAWPAIGWPAGERPDAAQYFKAPQMVSAALSPDGQRLAMGTVGPHGRVLLSVLDLQSMVPTVVYSSDAADLGRMVWVNNQRVAFTLADLNVPAGQQDAGPGLFAVDVDGKAFKQLVERQAVWARNGNDTRRLEPWNTYLLNGTTQREGDEVLVARPEAYDSKDWDYIKLLRLNTRNGRIEEVDGPLHSVGWWADAKGVLRVAQTRDGEKGALRWNDPVSGQWRTLTEFNAYTEGGDFQVNRVGADGRLYVSARRGSDKLALWLLDPATGAWSGQPLVQSPDFDVDAEIVDRQDRVLGYRFTIDAEVTQWVDADMAALQQQVDKVLPRTVNRLSVPWQGDSPWVLVEAFADIQPTLYFLHDRRTRKFTRLGAQRPDIDARTQAASELVRVKARDGLEIPVWVTRPRGVEARSLPTVVLVHGGPFSPGPSWQWDEAVQFLAARGFAVVQPQFRGTLGYGLKHFKAGWRQWGQAMQTDLVDVTRWAIAQGLADARRIALAGASYGGYATLMGLARDADLFRCGVAWVGVTDLDMLYTVDWDDISPSFKRHGMPQLLGDRVEDAATLKAQSPITHAARIRQPLLLAYGGRDRRVPLVHGETFRKAVQPASTALEWVVYEDEGHGWRDPKNLNDFWNRTARFLDRHLSLNPLPE